MSQYDDKDKVKKRQNRLEYQESRRLEAFASVIATEQGRFVLNWLLSECGIMRISYSAKLPNEATFFNEGMRNVGLKIFSIIDANFSKEWLLMREEARKREEEINDA